MNKKSVFFILAIVAMFSLVACTKDQVLDPKDSAETELLAGESTLAVSNTQKMKSWIVPLSGANENPSIVTPMVGTAFASLYKTGTRFFLTYTITLRKIPSGRIINAAHIHNGISTANGGVVWHLYNASNLTLASFRTVKTDAAVIKGNKIFLTEAQFNNLLNGTSPYYVNVHTNAFPTGEVRGQLEAGL